MIPIAVQMDWPGIWVGRFNDTIQAKWLIGNGIPFNYRGTFINQKLDKKNNIFRKGAFDSISASYRRFPLLIFEKDGQMKSCC